MMYIPPEKRPRAPPTSSDEYIPVDIVTTPPELQRVCACAQCTKPVLAELEEPICLQFTGVPLRTVRTRTLILRNECVVTARWSAVVRRWPRVHARSLHADQWRGDVSAVGVALQCAPARGVLAAHALVHVHVHVYADCWGLYYDQILIQIENVEPIVLDVWMEVVGPPLQLALQPTDQYLDVAPVMWMSASDPERVLRAKNVSRSELTVYAYIARDHEYPQDMLPLRLYWRSYDVLPRTCPCLTAFDSYNLIGERSDTSSFEEEMDTGFELYLGPDYGPQDDTFYTVQPQVRTIGAGACAEWRVTLEPRDDQLAPDTNLLLRLLPVHFTGASWYRAEPPPQVVRLRQAPREPRLRVSQRELRVHLCALDLPYADILRVRKHFQVTNVGNGPLEVGAETSAPWCVVAERVTSGAPAAEHAHCGTGCWCNERDALRERKLALYLEPRSCLEMCMEVEVSTIEAWPKVPTAAGGLPAPCQAFLYPEHCITTTQLYLFDDDNVLATIPLILDLEYPSLLVEPSDIDFGFVADGDTRKTYFSVSHTSRTVTLDVATEWVGSKEFQIWPPFLQIPPGASKRVYLQYTAVWRSGLEEGCVRVSVCCGAGRDGGAGAGACAGAGAGAGVAAWCRAAVVVHAAPARDHNCHITLHDYTDDPHLLPPGINPST